MADHDPTQADMLKTFVADRNVPCPVCGYNLRNLSSAQCPECSASLEMRVGSSDLRMGMWLVALLSAALPLGFGVLVSVIVFLATYGEPEWEFHIAFGLLSIIEGGLVAWLVVRRRAFWAMPRPRQRALTWLVAVLSIACVSALMWWAWLM